MEIVFHAHHTVISDALRARAERIVHKAAARLRRIVGATVRFEDDGPTKRVEIALHAPTHRPLVAAGEGRLFGPALSSAAAHLLVQVAKTDMARARIRRSPIVRAADAADVADAGVDEPDVELDPSDDDESGSETAAEPAPRSTAEDGATGR